MLRDITNYKSIVKMPSDSNNQRVSVVFEKNKNNITAPISGAWGGATPDGNSIVAHFYIEHQTTPNSIESEVKEGEPFNPNLGNQIRRGDITREIQATLVMSPEQAISIGGWLANKGQQIINQRNQGNNG